MSRIRPSIVVDSRCLGVVLLMFVGSSMARAEIPAAVRVAPHEVVKAARDAPDPASVSEVLRLPAAALHAAAVLEELVSQQIAPGAPYRNGFSRSGEGSRVGVPADIWFTGFNGPGVVLPHSDSRMTWSGRFVVEDAYAFRVRLADVELPEGTRIWISNSDLRLGPYGQEMVDPEGGIWLPPVPGPEAVVEVEVPAADGVLRSPLAFSLGEVIELVSDPLETTSDSLDWTECAIDATCVSDSSLSTIDLLREAVARLSFVVGSSSYLCTGALLNDKDVLDFRPYLLTAHHCFSTQTAASSLIAYFDYRTSSCDGTGPSLFSVPSVAGATLLATGFASDFTFVELSANPSGTTAYLGSKSDSISAGNLLHRVSHPEGTTQKYSQSSLAEQGIVDCIGSRDIWDFHYSGGFTGSTAGGSSGAPLTDDQARVVGQLFGVCHWTTPDACNPFSYYVVDGAIGATMPHIAEWLNECADDFEPDDTTGDATELFSDSPQTHSICPATDEDWFSFSLAEPSAVLVETSGPTPADTHLWLFDSEFVVIEFDDDGGDERYSRIDRSCEEESLAAGSYFIKVDVVGELNEIPEYQLSYTGTPCGDACQTNLTLSNTTLTGTQTHRASQMITLGPDLTIAGTEVTVLAGERVLITNGTNIGGSFSAGIQNCNP